MSKYTDILRNCKLQKARLRPFYKDGSVCAIGAIVIGLGYEPEYDDQFNINSTNNIKNAVNEEDAYSILEDLIGHDVVCEIYGLNDDNAMDLTFVQIANFLDAKYPNLGENITK